jgi:TetR/AcrR family transcriptional regulator, cholesterol catabolism regulator
VEKSAVKRSSRDAIFAATIQLFSERGYSSTSMRDIAHAVGLLPGSLYVHISSKEQLLADIVETGIDRFMRACRDAIDSEESPAARMRAVIHAHMALIAEDAEHVRVALHQWKYLTGTRRAEIMEKRREYEGLFQSLIADGVALGEFSAKLNARIAVLTVVGTLNWTSEWFNADGPESADQVADEIADVLLSGLGA